MPPVGKAAEKGLGRLAKALFGSAKLIGPEDLAPRLHSYGEADQILLNRLAPSARPRYQAKVEPYEILSPEFEPGAQGLAPELAEGMVEGSAQRIAKEYSEITNIPPIVIGQQSLSPRAIGQLLGRLTADPEIAPVVYGAMRRAAILTRRRKPETDIIDVRPGKLPSAAGLTRLTPISIANPTREAVHTKVLVGGDLSAGKTAAHELGHVMFGIDDPQATANTMFELLQLSPGARQAILGEARELSVFASPGAWDARAASSAARNWTAQPAEWVADGLAMAIIHPEMVREFAPRFTKLLRQFNDVPRLRRMGVTVAGVAPLVLAGAALTQSTPTTFDLRSAQERR